MFKREGLARKKKQGRGTSHKIIKREGLAVKCSSERD